MKPGWMYTLIVVALLYLGVFKDMSGWGMVALLLALSIGVRWTCWFTAREKQREENHEREKEERTRQLVSDADEQHAATLRGDDQTGTYGRFPPQC